MKELPTTETEFDKLPVIDWNYCLEMANNQQEVAQELLTLIIQQLPADLETLQQAFQQQHYAELQRYAHKLHGALCYTGLPRLRQTVARIENFLKKKDTDASTLATLIAEMMHEAEKVFTTEWNKEL